MKTSNSVVGALSAVFLTLVTVGAAPAFAASTDDTQSPRGQVSATLGDEQSPRGEVRASTGDVQSPRGGFRAQTDDVQSPRGQDAQAPATQDDAQSPRSAR